MIAVGFVAVLFACAALPEPANWIIGVAFIATFPLMYRFARSVR